MKKKNLLEFGVQNVQREFLNVNDLAEVVYFLIKKKKSEIMSILSGEDISIKKLSYLIKNYCYQ